MHGNTSAAVGDFVRAHLEVFHVHGVVSVEVLLQIFFDASIEVGLDGMRAAPGHLDDFSVSDDQFTILEYIVRVGKHLLAVGVIGINRNVSSCAGAQMSAVMQAQQAGSTGTSGSQQMPNPARVTMLPVNGNSVP